jgi:hypothetical protein
LAYLREFFLALAPSELQAQAQILIFTLNQAKIQKWVHFLGPLHWTQSHSQSQIHQG